MKNGLSFAFPDHHLSFAVPRLTSLAVSLTHTVAAAGDRVSETERGSRAGHQDERGAKGASERGRGKRTRIDRSSGSSSRSRGKRCSLSTLAISLTLPGLSLSLTRSLTLLHSLTRRHFLSRQSIAGASVGTRHLETRMTLHILLSCRSQVVMRTIFPASTASPSPSWTQTVWLHTQLTLMPGARSARLRCLRRRDGLIGI